MNYPTPQYPGFPQQPAQPAPQYPPQPYQQPAPPMPAPQYPTQAYPQAPPAPYPGQQQAPQQPLANGTLDDFYSQPSSGGGPGISWKDKPIGTSYAGVVARDVTNADIQQDTDYRTGTPLTFRDGRPKFLMKVPLKVQPSPEFPEGDAVFFVRGQSRDELARAMSEVGASGAPTAGSAMVITLVERRPSRQGNPANIVQIRYQPAQGSGQAPAQPAPPSAAPAVPEQQQAPAVPQFQAPQVPAQPSMPQPATEPVQQQVPQPPAPQPAGGQTVPQPPPGLSEQQQQLLAQLGGLQQAG